ncbi:MAG TPA: 3D domain-containing protein [bacterium]|nr:3D domain-containing protein [bacterium]
MTRRLGLLLAAVALGLSPLLAGLVAELRGQVRAHTPVRSVVRRDQDPSPRFSPGPRLPKGCLLRLQDARPDRWCLLVEWDVDHEKVIKPIRRLSQGRPAWVLRGVGQAQPDWNWPRLAVARRQLSLTATGYDPGPVDNSRGWVGSTRTGARARFGVAAVDPRLIRLGSLLYVEGYGPALAADVGGAIKGGRIDLCFNSTEEARAWGRRKVRVWLVDPAGKRDRESLRGLAGL